MKNNQLEDTYLNQTIQHQLLNAGCPVTSIQKFLGHKKLNTTMIYARAYDKTVEADYYAAMGRIEQRLELVGQPEEIPEPPGVSKRGQLLSLAEQLFAPEMTLERRQEIAMQMCGLLDGRQTDRVDWIPPPAPVLANAETT